ncbi:ABC transporter substrate-binding protein [bacterium]|nr:MAG: ABC transporter substrate-binding protein [bacterium]
MMSRYVLLLALFLGFLPVGADAQSLPLVRIAYGTSGENPTALWVGVDQGFYRSHGVNVEVLFVRSGPLGLSAMVSGEIQMVFTSSSTTLSAVAGGLDVAVVAAVINKAEGEFIARPEIQKPEDLKGKQVGIQSRGGGGWANNMLALDYLNLDPERDRIQFVVLGDQASRVQALDLGRVQASWLGYNFGAPLKKKGFPVLVDLGRSPISYLGTSLVTRRFFMRQNPKAVEGVIRGTLGAIRFIRKPENKPAVIRTMMRQLRLNRAEDAETGYQALRETYSLDILPRVEGVRKIYQILLKANPNLQKIRPEDVIEDSFARKIMETGP